MTIRYVDPVNGNNAWDGLAPNFVSGTNGPKLTANGAEDSPVAPGDKVWCRTNAPYRELLTVDVSGTAGNPIVYEADNFGVIWPPGGVGRITGSDNDTTTARANCITATSRNYRTFRGFMFDTCSGVIVNLATACSGWIIEDFVAQGTAATSNMFAIGGTGTGNTIRRGLFLSGKNAGAIDFTHSVVVDNAGHVVENVMFLGGQAGVTDNRVGGITVRNCAFIGMAVRGVRVITALTVGQTMVVNNCLFAWCALALHGTVTGEVVENYNALYGNTTDRTNVATGANSNTFPPLFNPLQLLSGFNLPQFAPFSLSEWSPVKALAGTGEAADDLFGLTRAATSAKKSWGPVQWVDAKRETTTVQAGAASLKLADAGLVRVRRIPVTAVSTTISLYVRWEADYVGTKPRMVLKQPDQADRATTATGAVDTWEQLTDTFTPAALPPYVDVYLESSNTATAGNYDTFADTLAVA